MKEKIKKWEDITPEDTSEENWGKGGRLYRWKKKCRGGARYEIPWGNGSEI